MERLVLEFYSSRCLAHGSGEEPLDCKGASKAYLSEAVLPIRIGNEPRSFTLKINEPKTIDATARKAYGLSSLS